MRYLSGLISLPHPSCHSAASIQASLLVLKHTRQAPATGPLHSLFLLPQTSFPQISTELTPWSPFCFVHMSGKWASLTTLFKISSQKKKKKFSFPLKPPPHSYFFFIITFIPFLRKLFWGYMLGKIPWRIPWTTGSQRVGHDRATFMLGVSFGTWTLSCNMKTLVPRARDQTPTPSPVSTHSFWAWYAPYRKKGGGEVERRARETAYL